MPSLPRTFHDATMNEAPTWDTQIASLLEELSSVQADLLALLNKKREQIAAKDSMGLKSLAASEAQLTDRLMNCHRKRGELLASAGREGLPSDSLQALAATLPLNERKRLGPEINAARHRSRLLQHQSLTNWVLVQRTLLHLSQMIEIIATGGQMKPTYGDSPSARTGGALVDQAV